MSESIRKASLRCVVLIFAIWPMVHFCAVQTLEFDPWKLGGFAMYTRPRVWPSMNLYGIQGNIPYPIRPPQVPESTVSIIEEYIRASRSYGPQFRPDKAGRQLLEDLPQFDTIRLVVSRLELDPQNDRLRQRTDTFEYPHEASRP